MSSLGLIEKIIVQLHAGTLFDDPLQNWFEQKVPKTTIARIIFRRLSEESFAASSPTTKVVFPWTGTFIGSDHKIKKRNQWK